MNWLFLATIGMLIWSVTAVVDRFALHGRISSQRFYLIIPTLLQFFLVLVFYPFFQPTSWLVSVIIAGVGSGLVSVVFLYYLYKSISVVEVSRIFPLMSVSAVLTLLGSFLFLGETLTQVQLLAFMLFVFGGVILAIKKHTESNTYQFLPIAALKPLFFGAILISSFTLLARYAFISSDFATGFFFSRMGFFMGGIILLLIWRKEIWDQWKLLRKRMKAIVIGNQVIAFSGHAFYFSALALANAALVQSVLAVQSLVVFALATLVSFINPNLVGESITRHDLMQKTIGVIFVTIAVFLLI